MERILACLSPSPSNPKILRAAADMAGDREELIALFVETPQFSQLANADRRRLQENMQIAEQLGAKIQTVSGDDVAFQVAEYVRLSGIQKIVLGQSDFKLSLLPAQTSLPDRLAEYLPNAEIHVIPDRKRSIYFPPRRERVSRRRIAMDVVVTLAMLTAATLLGMALFGSNLSNSSIMMVYLLGVLLVAVIASHRACSIAASVASLFLFNFFFVQPRYSLVAYEPGYPVSFIVMFLTAAIAGTLANRLKQTAYQAARISFRARIISDTDQLLAKAENREEILRVCAEQSAKLLGRGIVLYDVAESSTGGHIAIPEDIAPVSDGRELLTENLANGQAENWCYPIHVQKKIYAILQIVEHDPPPELPAQSTLISVLGECALALENEKNAREKEAAAVLAENERLRANLLRSISHDLRTPLMSIAGNAGALLANEKRYPEDTRHRLYSDIYEDSLWLTGLVENLLANTAFADLPLLMSLIASHNYLPKQLVNRGSRLNFSNGILFLFGMASLLVFIFRGSQHLLLPLYASGVFISFFLSQFGMFTHWRKRKGPHWKFKAAVNGFGSVLTGTVLIIIVIMKFMRGAWVALLLIALFILIMLNIKRHYEKISADLTISSVERALAEINREKTARVIIPVQSLNKSFIKTLNCALSCGFSSMELYNVCSTQERALQIKEQVESLGINCEFRYDVTTLRNTNDILLSHIRQEADKLKNERLIVMMGGLVVTSPFKKILHNSTTHRLMRKMETYRNVYVFSVPYVIE